MTTFTIIFITMPSSRLIASLSFLIIMIFDLQLGIIFTMSCLSTVIAPLHGWCRLVIMEIIIQHSYRLLYLPAYHVNYRFHLPLSYSILSAWCKCILSIAWHDVIMKFISWRFRHETRWVIVDETNDKCHVDAGTPASSVSSISQGDLYLRQDWAPETRIGPYLINFTPSAEILRMQAWFHRHYTPSIYFATIGIILLMQMYWASKSKRRNIISKSDELACAIALMKILAL